MITISKYIKKGVRACGRTCLALHMSLLALTAVLTGCGDYLEIIPENYLAVDNFWQSKSDVEASLNSGYYYLRDAVEDCLIPWGEQRAGVIYGDSKVGANTLQTWQIKSTNSIASWAKMYRIVNEANLVLKNASKAQGSDRTYTSSEVNSHYCEAYFLRALAYFYILRNWGEAPIVTEPYETDETPLAIAKSSKSELTAFIKNDLQTAISLGAAKDAWDTTWETKGKATKWSIYALMADVCLWNQDFDEAVKYADMILTDNTANAPKLITTNTHDGWFSIFNPGNSKESIFEIQYNANLKDGSGYQTNNLYALFSSGSEACYHISQYAMQQFDEDYQYQRVNKQVALYPENACRTLNGSYTGSAMGGGYVWKYLGGPTINEERTSAYHDQNFIIYRVADVMLMKAEALVMRSGGTDVEDKAEALSLVNQIRNRSNLEPRQWGDDDALAILMDDIITERVMELLAEGKVWYDFLRISRYPSSEGFPDPKAAIVNKIMQYSLNNGKASITWIYSVLMNDDAWYLPVYENELKYNKSLIQNKYYK